ncbi:hypothetical protein T4D_2896 [Trichinella pseudospiralis]|uniref:Uncharacterized protein n=1 Tax=Trichinella pseudospiralis TaxID=6337 RepID=A0A0V1FZ34_TRIPS|nr:hypothetical protein T4D_2896 [Trichinella pseudospiralis]
MVNEEKKLFIEKYVKRLTNFVHLTLCPSLLVLHLQRRCVFPGLRVSRHTQNLMHNFYFSRQHNTPGHHSTRLRLWSLSDIS